MKFALFLLCVCVAAGPASAQSAATTPSANAPPMGSGPNTNVLPELDRLQSAASQQAINVAHLRIEKWKTDGDSKQQAQAKADAIQRNLISALPRMISDVRAAPQNLPVNFKLYRNLNALYDVMASLTESAGAFGPKDDYAALAQQLQVIDGVRRDLGDNLEQLAASTQAELTQLQNQVRQQQAAAAAAPPKKVVVDDNAPVKKSAHKKKPATKKPAAASSAADSSTPKS